MKDYFYLQFLLTNRRIKEVGIHPFLGYLLSLIVFILVSEYAFQKTAFASYLFLLICLALQLKLSKKNRMDFLLTTFGDTQKRIIRMLENFLVSIPFLVLLLYKNAFLEVLILLIMSFLLAVFSFQSNFSATVPTPFSRRPFEFLVGFRKTFFIFPVVYALAVIAISLDNFNLGLFSMGLIFITSYTYYSKPEEEYYVWVNARSPRAFLMYKIGEATVNVSLLMLPILIGLFVFYLDETKFILILFLSGLLFLWAIILGKYSAYPREMNLPEGILLAFSLFFPPFLVVIIPYFYIKSIIKLKLLLDDQH